MSTLRPALRPRDALLLLGVTLIWGSNFVVIKVGLQAFAPMLLAVIRFAVSAFPLAFFLPRPPVDWRWLALHGLATGAGQFGLLFWALQADISPGMASLLMQTQVFSTIVLAGLLFHERVAPRQWLGLALGGLGLATVGLHLDGGGALTPAGLAMTLGAASFWAASNLITKHAVRRSTQRLDMLAFIVWSSVFALPGMGVLLMIVVGPTAAMQQLGGAGLWPWMAGLWQAVGNALVGFVIWSALLARYPASVVTPWALLVPVFGMSSAALLLDEPFPPWKLLAAVLVMVGIAITTWPTRTTLPPPLPPPL